MANALQVCEGQMGSLLAALHVEEANHLTDLDGDARREKLAQLCIRELKKLLNSQAALSLSVQESAYDAAADALSARMGYHAGRERAQQEELAKRFKR